MQPTWNSLAPILRGEDIRRERVWDVVERHHEFLTGAVRHVLRGAGDVTAAFSQDREQANEEALQWVAEHLVRRVLSEPLGLQVADRTDGAPSSATKWFFTVIANLARDWVRGERRRHRREQQVEPPPAPRHEPVSAFWDTSALRKLQRLLQRPDRAGVPSTHVLAYLCQYRPEAVDRSMIERAVEYRSPAGSRSGRKGLYRDADTTWTYLQEWRGRNEDATLTTEARAELAWIFRSDDPGPPETWRDRAPDAAKTATVTVGKWAIRCADVLTLPRK